jgi:hypothetical protein
MVLLAGSWWPVACSLCFWLLASRVQHIPAVLVFLSMVKFLLWCLLLVLCWPLAILAVIFYPLVWIVLIPFRIAGMAVSGVLELLRGIIMLPARLIGGRTAGSR